MTRDPDQIRRTLASALGVGENEVTLERRLSDIQELDSLSLVEIATELDSDFEIRLPIETLAESMTVGELVALVERAPRR